MNDREARAVIDALESGQQFSFSSYSADARETLVFDAVAARFVLTVYNAYDPETTLRSELTRDELEERLRTGFSYSSFGLPPVGTPLARLPGTAGPAEK